MNERIVVCCARRALSGEGCRSRGAFYTDHLGFKLEHQQLPAFASVSLGEFTLLLSGPGASGSRPMPGGQSQEPGGWNRVVLRVTDLPALSTR